MLSVVVVFFVKTYFQPLILRCGNAEARSFVHGAGNISGSGRLRYIVKSKENIQSDIAQRRTFGFHQPWVLGHRCLARLTTNIHLERILSALAKGCETVRLTFSPIFSPSLSADIWAYSKANHNYP